MPRRPTARTSICRSSRDVPLAAGTAVLFHSNIVHGSGPNHSDRPRHTALYAYFPPTARYTPSPSPTLPAKTYPVVAGLNGLTSVTLGVGESALERHAAPIERHDIYGHMVAEAEVVGAAFRAI